MLVRMAKVECESGSKARGVEDWHACCKRVDRPRVSRGSSRAKRGPQARSFARSCSCRDLVKESNTRPCHLASSLHYLSYCSTLLLLTFANHGSTLTTRSLSPRLRHSRTRRHGLCSEYELPFLSSLVEVFKLTISRNLAHTTTARTPRRSHPNERAMRRSNQHGHERPRLCCPSSRLLRQ